MAPTKNSKEQKSAVVPAGATPPSSSAKAATSPKKKKAFSPTRKAGGFNHIPVILGQTKDICELGIIDVGLSPLYIVPVEKEKGGAAFYVPKIGKLMEISERRKDSGGFLMIFYQRDPKKAGKPLTTMNTNIKEYTHDVFLLTSEYTTPVGKEPSHSDYFVNTSMFAKFFNAFLEESHDGDFQYGAPVYVNKRNKTPAASACLFDFLMFNDCVTVMKRFDGVDSKSDFMAHEERDDILKLIFGDADKGFELVNIIDGMIYNNL